MQCFMEVLPEKDLKYERFSLIMLQMAFDPNCSSAPLKISELLISLGLMVCHSQSEGRLEHTAWK